MKNGYQQNTKPDAIVSSDPSVWLSSFDRDPPYSSSALSSFNRRAALPSTPGEESEAPVAPDASVVEPPPIHRSAPELVPAAVEALEGVPVTLPRSAELQSQLTTALRPETTTLYLYHQPRGHCAALSLHPVRRARRKKLRRRIRSKIPRTMTMGLKAILRIGMSHTGYMTLSRVDYLANHKRNGSTTRVQPRYPLRCL